MNFFFMLHQQLPLNFQYFQVSQVDKSVSLRSLLSDIVQENHFLFNMETRDRPNNLVRLFIELHALGASNEQLVTAYQRNLHDVESITATVSTKLINQDNWKDYLGNTSYYKEYLLFFDSELESLGLKETLNRYFYSIEYSIGSQLQPITQLSFGIEQDMPEIISQALAYYASSYLDVSNILEYCADDQNPESSEEFDPTLVNKILFDFVHVDRRFGGKIKGRHNTFQSSVKLLLKSQSDLLKTYLKTWSNYSLSASDRLEILIYTALTLIQVSSRQLIEDGPIEMDWFLAGGQLLESALAIQSMVHSSDHLTNWAHLQFLSTLCTFIVQGRPMYEKMSWMATETRNVQDILHYAFDDAKLMLTVSSILKVQELYPHYNEQCMDIIQLLTRFSKNGAWVKCGLGW